MYQPNQCTTHRYRRAWEWLPIIYNNKYVYCRGVLLMSSSRSAASWAIFVMKLLWRAADLRRGFLYTIWLNQMD